MTYEQRIDMYKHKKLFIEGISKVFQNESLMSNVESIDYVVLTKVIDKDTTDYQEFVIITFTSGAKSIRTITGSSNNANFREIGKLIDGGYYDEVPYYSSLLESGYAEVNLDKEEYLDLYEVRFDEDGQNMNETFTDKDKAIKYAEDNKDCLPVVYLIDGTTGDEEPIYMVED